MSWQAASMAVQLAGLAALAWAAWRDARTGLVPVRVAWGAAVVTASILAMISRSAGPLAGLAFGAGFTGLTALAGRGAWMGRGDVPAAALAGALAGWPGAAYAVLGAFVVLAPWGLAIGRSALPLVPGLLVASAIWLVLSTIHILPV